MITFYQFLLGACLYVIVCNNSNNNNNNNRRTGLKKAEENVTCTTNNKKENVKTTTTTTTTNQLCTLHDNDKNKCTTTNAHAWKVTECDDYLIDATLLYYGGVGFQAIVPFEEFQPEFLNGHHGPHLTPFPYVLIFM
jgi:CRISPR/Cas system CSM-associated protein Csm2 small subunit